MRGQSRHAKLQWTREQQQHDCSSSSGARIAGSAPPRPASTSDTVLVQAAGRGNGATGRHSRVYIRSTATDPRSAPPAAALAQTQPATAPGHQQQQQLPDGTDVVTASAGPQHVSHQQPGRPAQHAAQGHMVQHRAVPQQEPSNGAGAALGQKRSVLHGADLPGNKRQHAQLGPVTQPVQQQPPQQQQGGQSKQRQHSGTTATVAAAKQPPQQQLPRVLQAKPGAAHRQAQVKQPEQAAQLAHSSDPHHSMHTTQLLQKQQQQQEQQPRAQHQAQQQQQRLQHQQPHMRTQGTSSAPVQQHSVGQQTGMASAGSPARRGLPQAAAAANVTAAPSRAAAVTGAATATGGPWAAGSASATFAHKPCSRAAAIAAAKALVPQHTGKPRPAAAAAAGRVTAAGGMGAAAGRGAAAGGRAQKAVGVGAGRGRQQLRPTQIITRPTQSNSNCQLVYAKSRNKLQRTAVKAAVAGAHLTWVNTAAAPHLAEAAAASVASAAAVAAARQQRRTAALKKQHDARQQKLAKRRQQQQRVKAAAAVAGEATAGVAKRQQLLRSVNLAPGKRGMPRLAPARRPAGTLKLVRIGEQMFYQTSKGLRSLHAASSAGSAAAAAAGSGASSAADRTPSRDTAGLLPLLLRSPGLRRRSSLGAGLPVGRASARAAAAAAASARSRRTLAAKRRTGGGGGKRGRGLCLYFCRFGECGRQQKGECGLVHDPSKVAVCTHWLAGSCSAGDKCKRQHKVVRELMPVCTYFLEGKCSSQACPYLHIKVAADAPVCKDFLDGYCPKGLACTHKHLSHRMAKQLQGGGEGQGSQQQQREAGGVGVTAGLAAAAAAAAGAAVGTAAATAGAAAAAEGTGELAGGQQQQQNEGDLVNCQVPGECAAGGAAGDGPTAAAAAAAEGGVGAAGGGLLSQGEGGVHPSSLQGLLALLPEEDEDDEW